MRYGSIKKEKREQMLGRELTISIIGTMVRPGWVTCPLIDQSLAPKRQSYKMAALIYTLLR